MRSYPIDIHSRTAASPAAPAGHPVAFAPNAMSCSSAPAAALIRGRIGLGENFDNK
jgi:hypothetical protein